MPDPVSDPDPTPTDPTKDQDPTHAEAAQNSAPDETELTDEQLSNAAGGHVVPPDINPRHDILKHRIIYPDGEVH